MLRFQNPSTAGLAIWLVLMASISKTAAQVEKTNLEIFEDLILSQAQPKSDPEQYLRYTKGLVFAANGFQIDPDPFPCTDLDPEKKLAVLINEVDAIRICELCPKLPLEKFSSLQFIPELPENVFQVVHNSIYAECVMSCIETPDCLATNYNSADKTCSFFNSTRGELKATPNSIFVTPYQPTGIIRDWVHSRNTRISKIPINDSSIENSTEIPITKTETLLSNLSFLDCLAACDTNSSDCRYVSFSFNDQECLLIHNLTGGNYEITYEYGHLAAFKQEGLISSSGTRNGWRFQRVAATFEDMEKIDEDALFKELISNQNSSITKEHDYVDNLGCKLQPLPGCDQYTGKQKCRYPENLPELADKELPICPGSRYAVYKSLEKLYEAKEVCLSTCSNVDSCIGITWKVDKQQLDSPECTLVTYKTLLEQLRNLDDKEFYSLTTPRNPSFGFSVHPRLQIDPSLNSDNTKVLTNMPDAETCIANCNSNPVECNKASYNVVDKKCYLSKGETLFIDSPESILLVRPPMLNATAIAYTRLIGAVFTGKSLAVQRQDSNFEDLSGNVDQCLQYCLNYKIQNQTCDFVSLKIEKKSGIEATLECSFYNEDSGTVEAVAGSEVYVRTARSMQFSQSELDKVPILQRKDFPACFRKGPTNSFAYLEDFADDLIQEGTDLESNVTTKEILLRRKRGFLDFLKGVGEFFVGIGNDIKDTIVNGAEAIGHVFQGDFEAAWESVQEIPIVKDAKNTIESGIEFVDAVFSGDWDRAKDSGLDLVGSAAGLIPLPSGKAAGKVIKGIIGKPKTKIPSSKDKIKDPKKDKDAEESKKKDEACKKKSRSKRTTARSSNKRDCEDDDDDVCSAASLSNTVAYTSESSCLNRARKFKQNERCSLVCNAGYAENDRSPTCKKAPSSNDFSIMPKPACNPQSCGNTFTVSASTGNHLVFPNTDIAVYYVKYDKGKKLPIYSASIHDYRNYASRGGKRPSSFKKHPCSELENYQIADKDYSNTGWNKGHLTPNKAVAPLGVIPQRATFMLVNIAPQDPWTNSGPWRKIEDHTNCFTKKNSGLVVTGICPNSIPTTTRLPNIPSCFWKLVCYKSPSSGRTMVVGFIGENSRVTKALEPERNRTVLQIRSQAEVRAAAGLNAVEAAEMWTKSYAALVRDRIPRINPIDCVNSNEVSVTWFDEARTRTKRSTDNEGETFGCSKNELADYWALISSPNSDDDDYSSEDEDGEDDYEGSEQEDYYGDDSVGTETFRSSSCGKRLIGYFPSWGTASFTNVQGKSLTHAVFAFFETFSDGSIKLGSADANNSPDYDRDVDISKKRLANFLRIQKSFSHLKTLFAVGGWENSQYFSSIASDPAKRLRFISSTLQIVDQYDFDGIDIDWEHPVTGGATEGIPEDKQNYVVLMKELRQSFDEHQSKTGRSEKYLISFAGAAGQWTLDPGLDLPNLLKYADFANVMTYDYFGAWASKWGAYTGPPSPLFFGNPKGFSGKVNADWTIKYYTCKSKRPHQINMGVPFYGRYWENVGDPIDPNDGMWRMAQSVGGEFKGGFVPWTEVQKYLSDPGFKQEFHEKAKVPYAFNPSTRIFLGYENPESLSYKVKYAEDYNVGGLMIWAIDQDDSDYSMLKTLMKADLCKITDDAKIVHRCPPIDEKRWWTPEDGYDKAGMCGKSAPLYKGYYPVCDPDDPGYSCCGAHGYCGSGEDFCDCPTCVDYRTYPEKIIEEPVKPSMPVNWYILTDPDGKRGRCGRGIPLLNGKIPICNPDDVNTHCCSSGGYCGASEGFCECDGCVDFKKTPDYVYKEKTWWEWADGEDKFGRCGPSAPRMDGKVAKCNVDSSSHCCAPSGWCGGGSDFCQCEGCVDFKKDPDHVYKDKTWWEWADGEDKFGRCGPTAPKMQGKDAQCNPDSPSYCCSSSGWCGSGQEFCDCDGCTNYKK